MSWDSATSVLYTVNPTIEQIDSLSKFVSEHADELKRCYEPKYASQRPPIAKFVSRLFVLLERQDMSDTDVDNRMTKAVEKIADLLTREDFFKGVFHYALMEGDVSLLELVYSSLFTEIVFNSDLTSLWFQERLDAEKNGVRSSPVAQALNILISVQFLDVRQDWTAVKPSSELLMSIHKFISASKDTVIKLCWALALYFMAQQHYTTEKDDDGIDIEPLMHELQLKAGVHWSQVLRDQLQVSITGLEILVTSLEVVKRQHALKFVSSQLLAQTVADVVSCLFTVSKPTESLCAALASAVEPYPGLQHVPWIPEEQLALIKSKCPASLGSLISTAQVLDLQSRIEYLNEMRSYACTVDASCLDFDINDSPVPGSDVRTTCSVAVLPARVTDRQGTLELAPDTRGTLLAWDGNDCLVMWYFTYNGWSLLGRILENADLIEKNKWKPMTVEILKLISITVDANVLTAMSAGLSRGDILDLITNRLQSWIHSKTLDHCDLAFDLLANFAHIDPARIWALLGSVRWSSNKVILMGVTRLLIAVWPTFDQTRSLHIRVMNIMVDLFGSQYLLTGDVSVLEIFKLFLPVSSNLQADLLSPSPLRDVSIAPLLANLHQPRVLEFCKFCIEVSKNNSLMTQQSQSTPSIADVTQPQTQSYLEKQLFAKSSEITTLFLSDDRDLRHPILQLWTVMLDNPEAPPLLAFLNKGQAELLKDEFVNIAVNKLEATSTIASLARFLTAAERQESLLVLLRESLLPTLEDRLQSFDDNKALAEILKALKLAKSPFKSSTIVTLEKKVSEEHTDLADLAALNVKKLAIDLLTKQIRIAPDSMNDFVSKVDKLTSNHVAIYGARPSLHSRLFSNLKTKWPAIASEGDTTGTFELNLSRLDSKLDHDPIWKSSYRPEVLEAINNRELVNVQTDVVGSWCQLMIITAKTQSAGITPSMLSQWVLQLLEANSNSLPVSLQRAEDERTAAALVILQDQRCEKTVRILDVIYHQLTELTMSPSAGLPAVKPRLISGMNIALIVLTNLNEETIRSDVNIIPILSGLLDVVVIKQLQIFGASEDTLQLQLLILSNCLRILKSAGRRPRELVQAMIESGSDVTILNEYTKTPITNPWKGEIIFTYIQEWLCSRIMTDTFVRNGLMNVLIDAPLSRLMQKGGITAHTEPELHSLWRHGVLPIVAYLLGELESRICEETLLFIENYRIQIGTCLEQWKVGQISMALIEETWVLSIILRSVDKASTDMLGVKFDEDELAKTIDVLLSHQKYLVSRIPPNVEVSDILKELRLFRDWLS